MEQIDSQNVVTIEGGAGMISLRPAGRPAYGFPAELYFKSGQLEGSQKVLIIDPIGFADALSQMHERLEGRASMEALEQDFELALTSDSLGHVTVDVRVERRLGEALEFELKYVFRIDQSYLPPVIAALHRNFADGNQ